MSTSPPRNRLLISPGIVLAFGALALGSCSSSGAANTSTSTAEVVVTVPTTPSTTSAPAISEDPTTSETTVEDVEAAVREVHTRFMTELFNRDEREVGPEAILVLAEELTTGRQLRRIQEAASTKLETGEQSVSPGYLSSIVTVEVADATAIVLDCSQDRGKRYSADGNLLVQSDDFFKLRETHLVLLEGQWAVEDFATGGDTRCDPSSSA